MVDNRQSGGQRPHARACVHYGGGEFMAYGSGEEQERHEGSRGRSSGAGGVQSAAAVGASAPSPSGHSMC